MTWKGEPLDDAELDDLLDAAAGMDLADEFTIRTPFGWSASSSNGTTRSA